MIKDVKPVNWILLGVGVVLGIAMIAIAAVDYMTDSTSLLLDLAPYVFFLVTVVASFVISIINRNNTGKYVSLACIVVALGCLALFIVKHVL